MPSGDSDVESDIGAEHQTLGLAAATARRELNRLVKAVPEEAAKLIDSIQSTAERDIRLSPDPTATRRHIAAETRVLDAIKHIVIHNMVPAFVLTGRSDATARVQVLTIRGEDLGI